MLGLLLEQQEELSMHGGPIGHVATQLSHYELSLRRPPDPPGTLPSPKPGTLNPEPLTPNPKAKPETSLRSRPEPLSQVDLDA